MARTARTALALGRTGQEITVDATPAPDQPDRVTAAAAQVLRQHTPGRDGWCRGCLALWGRLVFFEQCTQAQWAQAVHAFYAQRRQDDRPASSPD